MSERGEAERVRGAVGQIEPAVQRVRVAFGVGQSHQAQRHESSELLRVRSFLRQHISWTREAPSGDEEVISRSNHPDLRPLHHTRDERILLAAAFPGIPASSNTVGLTGLPKLFAARPRAPNTSP